MQSGTNILNSGRIIVFIILIFTTLDITNAVAQTDTSMIEISQPEKFFPETPWVQRKFHKYDNQSTTGDFSNNIWINALVRKQNSRSFFELNPHFLVATAYEQHTAQNYFFTGGGFEIDYKKSHWFCLNLDIKGYRANRHYTDSTRMQYNLVPGTFYSNTTLKGYNAMDLSVNAAFKPSSFFTIESGIDNQFIGDGYHSVISGRNTAPHPYAEFAANFWKINYAVRYHFMKDIRYPIFDQLHNKYMTSHQVNFRIHPKFHIYLWEAVVWKSEDSVAQRGYDMSYLNPVVFFRTVEFQLGNPSPDNVLMGAGFRYRPVRWIKFYGQALVDEFHLQDLKNQTGWWANKFAMQAGIKTRFTPNTHQIKLTTEVNMARPFTYSHIQSMQNYGSRYHPLAHPLGANFGEFLLAAQWQHKRWSAWFKTAMTATGTDTDEVNYGQNIYRSYTDRASEYNHEWLQGNLQKHISADVALGYTINVAMQLKISAGARRQANINRAGNSNRYFNEYYLRLSTYLTQDMKRLYRKEFY